MVMTTSSSTRVNALLPPFARVPRHLPPFARGGRGGRVKGDWGIELISRRAAGFIPTVSAWKATQVPMGGDTSFFKGPEKRSYAVAALKAGTYSFICQVHPTTMKGTLVVK